MRWLALIVCLCCSATLPAPAIAERNALTPYVYNRLVRAHDQFAAGESAAAIETIKVGYRGTREDSYPRAVLVYNHAQLLMQMERIDEGLGVIEDALDALPEEYAVNLQMLAARGYLIQGETALALAALERWKSVAGDEPEAEGLFLLGYCLAQLERFSESIPILEGAIDQSLTYSPRWIELLGAVYLQAGQYDNARALFLETAGKYPAEGRWWKQLARTLGLMEREVDAVAALNVSGHLDDLNASQRIALARLLSFVGAPESGARVLGQLGEEKLNDYETLRLLAQMYVLAREHDAAVATLERAVQHGDSIEPWLLLAQLLTERHEYEGAALRLEEGLARYPESADDGYLYLFAICQLRTGDLDAARETAQRIGDGDHAGRAKNLIEYIDDESARKRG